VGCSPERAQEVVATARVEGAEAVAMVKAAEREEVAVRVAVWAGTVGVAKAMVTVVAVVAVVALAEMVGVTKARAEMVGVTKARAEMVGVVGVAKERGMVAARVVAVRGVRMVTLGETVVAPAETARAVTLARLG